MNASAKSDQKRSATAAAARSFRVLLGALLCVACASKRLADPRAAVQAYAAAARSGDAKELYKLLSPTSRRDFGVVGVERLLQDSKRELAAHAKAISEPGAELEVRAQVRFVDGEVAQLSAGSDRRFRIDAASALPARADTPEAALSELRAALARRSYPAFIRVLSRDTASQLELWLSSLTESLEDPQALNVVIDGDRATVELGAGHRIELEREEGVWKVRDFE